MGSNRSITYITDIYSRKELRIFKIWILWFGLKCRYQDACNNRDFFPAHSLFQIFHDPRGLCSAESSARTF